MTLSTSLWAILHASWHAAVLTAIVLLAQALLRRHLPARWRFALWFLVLVRLSLIPLPESRWSLYNWLPAPERAAHLLPATAQPLAAHIDGASLAALENAAIPSHAPPPGLPINIWQIAAAFYLAGVAIVLARALLATIALRSTVRGARPIDDPALLAAVDAARRSVGLRRPLPARITTELPSPAVVGVLRPRLLLPLEVLTAFTPAELRFVFLHECAHIRRNDVALNYWLVLVAALHWFNPIVWLMLPRIRADRELACDEAVLLNTNETAAYGETLLKLAESSVLARPLVGAVGVVETRSFFKRRIRMIAAFRRTPAWLATPALGLIIVMAGATLTSAVTAAAQTAAKAAGVAPASAAPEPANGPSAEELKLRRQLDSRLKQLSADDQPLESVLAFLADQGGINMSVNWRALEAAGVDRHAKVSAKLTNVTCRKALETVLAGVKTGEHLAFAAEDNVLTVSTAEELSGPSHQMLRVYNVRDLLATPRVVVAATTEPAAAQQLQYSPEGDEVALLDTLESTASPDSWRDHGGTSSTLRIYKGLLVVTAPAAVHEEVSRVLDQLRAAIKDEHR
jgi:bla regulator protein BlaR1